MKQPIQFEYLNHRGVTSKRSVIVASLVYLHDPGWGYEAGWFINGFDIDKQADRNFALKGIIRPFADTDYSIHFQE